MHYIAKCSPFKARFLLGLLVFCGLVIGFSFDAYAQSNRELNNRIKRLENEIDTLSRAMFRGEQPPQGFGASGSGNAVQAD